MRDLLDKAVIRSLRLFGVDLDFASDVNGSRFSRISATLDLGARPGHAHCQELLDAGITHVVSALPESERSSMEFLKADFETLFLALNDEVSQDIAGAFPTLFGFVDSALASTARARILLHCEAGVSRSAALAIALVMRLERLRFFEAFCAVRDKRPQVLPNVGFASQLQRLEFELPPGTDKRAKGATLALFLHQVCNVPAELELIESMLDRHDHDALAALHAIFGPELPRVIQGVRL